MQEEKKTLCYVLYAIYAACVFLQFSIEGAVLSTVAILIGLVIASVERKKQAGSFLESHYRWLIRTFWIGGAVYLPIITVLMALIMAGIAMPAVNKIVESGENDPARIQAMFMTEYSGTLMLTGLVVMLPFAVWWLYRCIKGVHYLRLNRPLPKSESWL